MDGVNFFEDSRRIILESLHAAHGNLSKLRKYYIDNHRDVFFHVQKQILEEAKIIVSLKERFKQDNDEFDLTQKELEIVKSALVLYKNKIEKIPSQLFNKIPEKIKAIEEVIEFSVFDGVRDDLFFFPEESKVKDDANSMLIDNIVDTLQNINTLSKANFGFELFKCNAKLLKDTRKPCDNEDAFVILIANLGTLIDEAYIDDIYNKLNQKPAEKKSVLLIEQLLNENYSSFSPKIIDNLRRIKNLRNKKMPIHSREPDVIEIFKSWNLQYPPDWKIAGRVILERYFESLELLRDLLK